MIHKQIPSNLLEIRDQVQESVGKDRYPEWIVVFMGMVMEESLTYGGDYATAAGRIVNRLSKDCPTRLAIAAALVELHQPSDGVKKLRLT